MKLKIFGTDIQISYTLLCLIAFCIITEMFGKFLCCIFAVAIHEAGHLIFMCKYNCLPGKIKISLFEIAIDSCSRQQISLKKNIFIIFFGPFANFICFILFYLLYLICGGFFLHLAYANLSIGIFNILPVMSLDGGQLLYLLLKQKMSDKASERCINIATFIILFPLAVLGFLLTFSSEYNFSLLFVCVYIIFSLICRNNRYF